MTMNEVTINVEEIVGETWGAWHLRVGNDLFWLPKIAVREGGKYRVGLTGLVMLVERDAAQKLGLI